MWEDRPAVWPQTPQDDLSSRVYEAVIKKHSDFYEGIIFSLSNHTRKKGDIKELRYYICVRINDLYGLEQDYGQKNMAQNDHNVWLGL